MHYKDNFDEEHNWFPRPAPAVRSAIYQRLFCHRDDPTRQGYPQNLLEVSYLSERYALKLMSIVAHHYYLNCIVSCYAGDNDESGDIKFHTQEVMCKSLCWVVPLCHLISHGTASLLASAYRSDKNLDINLKHKATCCRKSMRTSEKYCTTDWTGNTCLVGSNFLMVFLTISTRRTNRRKMFWKRSN